MAAERTEILKLLDDCLSQAEVDALQSVTNDE